MCVARMVLLAAVPNRVPLDFPFNSNQFPKGFPLDLLSISLSRMRTSRRSTDPPLPYHFTSTLLAAGCRLLSAGCWLLAAGCWLLAAGGRLQGDTRGTLGEHSGSNDLNFEADVRNQWQNCGETQNEISFDHFPFQKTTKIKNEAVTRGSSEASTLASGRGPKTATPDPIYIPN